MSRRKEKSEVTKAINYYDELEFNCTLLHSIRCIMSGKTSYQY